MATAVQFERVVKTFGPLRAIDDLSLTIEPGELFFLLGPSGCGKTTLLRCLAGFYVPDSGVVLLGGEDITRRPPHERDTGMVFQSYALWPHLTVRENVAFGLELRKVPREELARRVSEALRLVKMADRADHRPAQLSGGQQQRVALARALVVQPKCLLLDEPLSNLDAKLRLDMRAEIRRICKESGLTALYVTHDQKEALSIADRLAVLDRGRIEQLGAPQEVYRRPANRFVAGFIGETHFLPATVTARDGGGVRLQTSAGELIATDAPPEAVPGADVTLSLRPEALRLDPPPAGAPNRLAGTLLETGYLGDVVRQAVRLAGHAGDTQVFELRPTVTARDGRTVPVQLWIAPDDVVVLTR